MTYYFCQKLLAMGALTGLFAQAAMAAPGWVEIGDAGQLPGTAQVTTGLGPLTTISGTLPTDPDFINPTLPPDIDLFRIVISDSSAFSATTVNPETEFIDTQLYLFRADGTGVVANGDTDAVESRSTIPAGSVSSAPVGEYLLGIALFESRPVNSSGDLLFPDLFFNEAVESPLLPDDPVADWNSLSIFEPFLNYQINLTGATFALPSKPTPDPIPEPASLVTWLSLVALLAVPTLRFARLRQPVPHQPAAPSRDQPATADFATHRARRRAGGDPS